MKINFSENVEALEPVILAYILNTDDYVLRDQEGNCVELTKLIYSLHPSFFTNALYKQIIDQIRIFYKKFNSVPSREELKKQLEIKEIEYSDLEFDEIFNTNLNKFTSEYLFGEIHTFLVVKTLNSELNKISQKLALSKPNADNIDDIMDDVRTTITQNMVVDITVDNDGLDIYDYESHIQPKKLTKPTGNGYLDLVLGGGWEPKTLIAFMGRPKIGKSLVISNLAVRAVSKGSNVGVYSVELGDRKYTKRIGSNLFGIPFTWYNDYVDEDSTKDIIPYIEEYRKKEPNTGKLIVKEAPTGAMTYYDIENYFIHEEKKRGIHFDVIFVDYVNLLRDPDNSDSLYLKIKHNCEGLRKIAQRNNWCIVTATQTNKSSFTSDDLQLDSVAESAGLVATVDTLIGLSSDNEETLKMKTVANRDNGHMGSYAMFVKDFQYYRLVEDCKDKNGDDYMFNLDDTKNLLRDSVNKIYDPSNAKSWGNEQNSSFLVNGKPVFEHDKDAHEEKQEVHNSAPVQEVNHPVAETHQAPVESLPCDDDAEMFNYIMNQDDPLCGQNIDLSDFDASKIEPACNLQSLDLSNIDTSNAMQASDVFKDDVVEEPHGLQAQPEISTLRDWSSYQTSINEDPKANEPVNTELIKPQIDNVRSWTPEQSIVKEPVQVLNEWKPEDSIISDQPTLIVHNEPVIVEPDPVDEEIKKDVVNVNYSSNYLVNKFESQEEHDAFIKKRPEDVISVLSGINDSILKSDES